MTQSEVDTELEFTPMPDRPLAYFITFTTYGTWLHGDERGSVDLEHNQVGTPWLEPDGRRQAVNRRKMAQNAYHLDESRRGIVLEAIIAECRYRGWPLHAVHVRSNHVHLVVSADEQPELVMRCCKAQASTRLNDAGFDDRGRKRWTARGSRRYLWDVAAVDYTVDGQGEPMAKFRARNPESNPDSEPER